MHGFAVPKVGILHGGPGADFALVIVYLIVAAVLVWLVTISRSLRERAYFALCACSGSFGLLRTVFGDASLPAAQYMRVLMLTSAVTVGGLILRSFSQTVVEPGIAK